MNESNAIGTAYLRAQTLPEPSEPDHWICCGSSPTRASGSPDGTGQRGAGRGHRRQRACPTSTVERGRGALAAQPTATAPRLYVESLNETFDAQSTRISGLDNRVPTAVLPWRWSAPPSPWGCSRSTSPRSAAALDRAGGRHLVTLTLVVTLDLDRPVRGLVQVNATPLTDVRASMANPPASAGP